MGRRFVVNRASADVNEDVAVAAIEQALVGRAQAGDGDSFTLLYQRHKLDIWNLAYFTLRDHHDAEDAVQDTFLKAYRSLGQHRPDEPLRAWLLAICRNACLDRLRRRTARPAVSLQDVDCPEPAGQAADVDGVLDFHRALAALAPEDREAFFLIDVLGCRSEEAARIAGVRAASTIRSRLGRARRAIAEDRVDPVPTVVPLRNAGPAGPAGSADGYRWTSAS